MKLTNMVGLGRVELPTYGLGNRRSIHLSYSPILSITSYTEMNIRTYTASLRLPGNYLPHVAIGGEYNLIPFAS
jgi:hypothetical protein